MSESFRGSKPNLDQVNSRLRIVVPSTDKKSSTSNTYNDVERGEERSGSPPRPSYSPVTPTLTHPSYPESNSDSKQTTSTKWMDEPISQPINHDDNSDAIALRAAISILQLQKQQAQRDIKSLEQMKQAALKDPEAFVEELKAGRLGPKPREGIHVDEMDDSEDEENSNDERDHVQTTDKPKFGIFPSAQDIVRTPPIEWSKYHVVGEALDRLHEIQKHYPGVTENMHGEPIQPYEIAAPYRPFSDKLEGRKIQSQKHEYNK